jgi:hypothetical protein
LRTICQITHKAGVLFVASTMTEDAPDLHQAHTVYLYAPTVATLLEDYQRRLAPM